MHYLGNASMPDHHLEYLNKKTNEEVQTGSVEPVTDWSQVRVLIPMFVVEQEGGKLRVIFDGRGLNAYLKEATGSVRYESVRDVMLLRAKCCTKLDLTAAFRHVRVADDQRDLLGFIVDGKVYRYACLPFGLSWSPALYIATLRPIIDAIRSNGIKLVWYVDDFIVFAQSREELDAALALILRTLADHGWRAATDKTFCHAYTRIPFLGLLVTIEPDGSINLRIPRTKRDRIVNSIRSIITAGQSSVVDMQRLLGRLNFTRIVLPEIGFGRSTADAAIAATMRVGKRPAPSLTIPIIGHLREELLALLGLLIDDRVLLRTAPHPDDVSTTTHHVFSDASAFGWGVILVDPHGPFRVPPPIAADLTDASIRDTRGWTRCGLFSPSECSLSSAAREIRAVTKGIIALNLRHCTIQWHSDSTCATAAINRWASPAQGVATALAELWSEVSRRGITLHVTHVKRELSLMPVADYLSRIGWRDKQAEWSLSYPDVNAILTRLRANCDSDLFASRRNHKFPFWCSQYLEEGSRGDAFFLTWWNRNWWAFPPLSIRSSVLRRLATLARVAKASRAVRSVAPANPPVANPPSFPPRRQPKSLSPRLHLSMVLVTTPIPTGSVDAPLWSELGPFVRNSAVVWNPSAPASSLIPSIRLLGDHGRAAPRPPPWPLLAHHIVITDHVL